MTEITQTLIDNLRKDLNVALKIIAAKYEVIIQPGNTTFTSTDGVMKLKIVVPPEGKTTTDLDGKSAELIKAEADWDKKATAFDLRKDWKGKEFIDLGKTVKVMGLIPRRHKYPVLVCDNTGLMYVLSISTIQHAFSHEHTIKRWVNDRSLSM
jgi:hypothetical protein